jgi:protein-disulfide isomerase
MDTIQKLAIPIAIVIAGGLIAAALYFVNTGNAGGGNLPTNSGQGTVAKEIRGVQSDDHILGSPNADIVIVEYSDTECPFCKQFHGTMHRIIDEYGAAGTVAWVYRHFPIPQLHSNAPKQAEALECAYEQGGNEAFWAYTDRLYELTPSNNGLDMNLLPEIAEEVGLDRTQFESCLASGRMAERVERDYNEVVAAGGRGTPHNIVLVDGDQIPVEGAQPYEVIKGLIDAVLAE